MRGSGIGAAYYDQYSIWSSEKDVLDIIKDSGVSLIMSIFAGKGATNVCFPSGTKVHTENGVVNIEDLEVGDLVLTYNVETHKPELKPIVEKHERYTQQMLSLELPTGEFLRVTPEYRFFCNDDWVEARNLQAGDLLHLKGGDYTTIIGVEILPHYEKVYNFDIADNENYYVTEDGILVHNGCRNDLVGRTPGKNSRTGREVFDRMLLDEVPPTARIKDDFGNAVKEFWDPDNKVWRDISEADMGHLHDAVDYWNDIVINHGPKSKEVRTWMLESKNYIYEYFSTNRSKGAIKGQTTRYKLPF